MLPRWVQVLFLLLAEAWSSRRDTQIRFLKVQVELLKQHLPGDRVILAPEERSRLLKLGEQMDHKVDDLLGIVYVKTYYVGCASEQWGGKWDEPVTLGGVLSHYYRKAA